jgi:hypothetical protein
MDNNKIIVPKKMIINTILHKIKTENFFTKDIIFLPFHYLITSFAMLLFNLILIMFGITTTVCLPLQSLFNSYDMDLINPAEIKRTYQLNKPDPMPIISRSMIEADKGHISSTNMSKALSNMRNIVSQIPNSLPEKRSILDYDYFLSNQERTSYNPFPAIQEMPFKRAFQQPSPFLYPPFNF